MKIKFSFVDFLFITLCLVEILFARSDLSNVFLVTFCSIQIFKFPEFIKSFKVTLLIAYAAFILIGLYNYYTGSSLNPQGSKIVLVQLFYNFVLMASVCTYLNNVSKDKLLKIMAIIAVLGSIAEILLNYMQSGSIVVRNLEGANSNLLAVYDAFIAVIYAFSNEKTFRKVPIVFFLLLFGILAGTRKATIAFVLSVVVIHLLNNPKSILKNIVFMALITVAAIVVLLKVPFFYDLIGYRFESLITLSQEGKGDASENARMFFIVEGFAGFLENMWRGHGLDAFREIVGEGSYAHNNYIELLYDLGILGVLTFYFMHLSILYCSLRDRIKNNLVFINMTIGVMLSMIFCDYAMVSYNERLSLLSIIFVYHYYRKNRNLLVYEKKYYT